MDRITIWLADENEHYSELMKRYIRTSIYKNKLSIAVYTDIECFKQSLEYVHSEAIVLVSALFIPLCTELINPTVIFLTEETSKEIADHPIHIYKYRPLNQILDQVLNIYYERKRYVHINTTISENKPKVMAVYSASGGSGVTTIALQLSEFYESLGKKAFYLNLEPINSMLSSSADGAVTRFTQVLYMIKSGQPLLGKLHQLLQSDHSGHYDMFHPARYSREWLEYEREDIQLLLQALKKTGRYDVIIMDVGSSLSSTTVGALEYCDEIFWVIPDRSGSLAKVEYVRDELGRLSSQLLEHVRNRSKFVQQLYSSLQTMKPNSSCDFDTVLPFIAEWQHSAAGAPPSPYRQALLRLIGTVTEEEMNQIGGPAGEAIHHLA
ncbi:MAG: hypothetical protein WD424_06780 [Paenibacillaceae bacterium]